MLGSLMKSSNLSSWENVPVEQLPDGVERQMIVGENLMICRVKFPPHVVAAAHAHPHEQMTLVEQGRALFLVGEEEKNRRTGRRDPHPAAFPARRDDAR